MITILQQVFNRRDANDCQDLQRVGKYQVAPSLDQDFHRLDLQLDGVNRMQFHAKLKPWANKETLLRKHYVSCQCFPVCSPRKTLLRKQNLLPRKQKCFPRNSETFLLRKQCFPSLPTCFQMFPSRETLFARLGKFKKCFKTIVQT